MHPYKTQCRNVTTLLWHKSRDTRDRHKTVSVHCVSTLLSVRVNSSVSTLVNSSVSTLVSMRVMCVHLHLCMYARALSPVQLPSRIWESKCRRDRSCPGTCTHSHMRVARMRFLSLILEAHSLPRISSLLHVECISCPIFERGNTREKGCARARAHTLTSTERFAVCLKKMPVSVCVCVCVSAHGAAHTPHAWASLKRALGWAHTSEETYICINICIYMCIYTHVCVYVYMHTYVYICIRGAHVKRDLDR